MSTKKKEPKPEPKPKTGELPLKGKGAEPVTIPAIQRAFDDYEPKKDRRCKALVLEKAAKAKLIEAMHANKDKLGRDPVDGALLYRYGERTIVLSTKETLSVVSDIEDSD